MPKITLPGGKKSLAGLVGGIAAGLLMLSVPRHEGEVLSTYYDPVGVATVCYGDTDPAMAIPGAAYSREECLRSLERQLIAHAEPVLECAPGVTASPEMTAAFVSLAYNIGTSAFCKSTAARRFRSGNYQEACAAISMWNKARGKVLPGLVRRRADERALCERGIPAMQQQGAFLRNAMSSGVARSGHEPGESALAAENVSSLPAAKMRSDSRTSHD